MHRGRVLAWLTIGWNAVEGIAGIASGLAAGSIALVGFGIESVRRLLSGAAVEESPFGIGLAVVSLIAMPLLARAKRRVGEQLESRAVQADATETVLCVWLSAILLVGLGANALFGWWWADPVAALGIVYIAGREGIQHWRADELDDCC